MYISLSLLIVFGFLYSVIASRLEKTIITGPMAFISFGMLINYLQIGSLEFDFKGEQLKLLVDLTLSLVLFLDATNADTSILRKYAKIPLRLLLCALPLTIVTGALIGWLIFPHFSWVQLAILATMLTATDAALGKAVFGNKAVPQHIRESLNVESGLNDGLCVPVLLVLIVIAQQSHSDQNGLTLAISYFISEVGIGVLTGVAVTFLAGEVVKIAWRKRWINEIWRQLPVIMIAFLCFSIAQALEGSGYIAAFVGGITFRVLAKKHTHELVLSAEGFSELLAMLTWITFGSLALTTIKQQFDWQILLYALLSLTLVRIVPVFVSLIGTKEPWYNKLFIGWFGPRGLASIVFAIIVLNANIPNSEDISVVVVYTVLLSAILHGISAVPYANKFQKANTGVVNSIKASRERLN
ncbi:cation:proton antiporter [Colwellia sp. MEBiC06753]